DASPISTWYRLDSRLLLSMPLPMVALPWGSRSISNTRLPSAARAAARLMAVVVLPTPPFWFAMQNTFAVRVDILFFMGFLDDSSRRGNAGHSIRGQQAAVCGERATGCHDARLQSLPRAPAPSWQPNDPIR